MAQHRGFPPARSGIVVASLVLAVICRGTEPSRAAEPSEWVAGAHSRARLIAGGTAPNTAVAAPALLAGIDIALAPRFITYWRDPGDAGVPPTFDFTGSVNLASAEVRYPAPAALDEAGAKAYGYTGEVVFPVLVHPRDAAQPVRLKVKLDYAACHEICLPATALLQGTISPEPSADAGLARDALAKVPRPVALGQLSGSLRLVSVRTTADGLAIEAEGAQDGTLFVEAPEGWAFEAGAPSGSGGPATVFPVKRVEQPKGEASPAGPVVLTLVAPAGAIEASVRLDATTSKP